MEALFLLALEPPLVSSLAMQLVRLFLSFRGRSRVQCNVLCSSCDILLSQCGIACH